MVATFRPDWEERTWQLAHDLVVRLALEVVEQGRDPTEAALQCVELAETAAAAYRATSTPGPGVEAL